MQYTQAGHSCVPSSLVLLVSDLASSDDSMPESRNGCAAAPAPPADVAFCSTAAAAATAAAAFFLLDLFGADADGASAFTGVSETLDEADDDDADEVGLRQVTGRGDGWPICETVLHRLPSGGIFA